MQAEGAATTEEGKEKSAKPSDDKSKDKCIKVIKVKQNLLQVKDINSDKAKEKETKKK